MAAVGTVRGVLAMRRSIAHSGGYQVLSIESQGGETAVVRNSLHELAHAR